jgi:glycine C-acetyltransferase
MYDNARGIVEAQLDQIRASGLWKSEHPITSAQGVQITVGDRPLLNFCANNYLGLASHPLVVAAAHRALDEYGYGVASVRFICGTQDLHRALEDELAEFFGFEQSILFGSCFDANGGVFETLLDSDDVVISDALNHASIIDGIRLCKARRMRYLHLDLDDLESRLREASSARLRLVVTDGVFSMDGDYAPLADICDLAGRYEALVMVDDSHASGFVGATGRGSPERSGVMGRVDILSSTLGKALGGAAGGFIAAHGPIVDLLRQRARPYLFSNALAPSLIAGSREALRLVARSSTLRDRLAANTTRFRAAMTAAGLDIRPGDHPIVPVMLGDARLASDMAARLLDEGIYVVGFSYPVVPHGQARIRVQVSAAHTDDQLDFAAAAFAQAQYILPRSS